MERVIQCDENGLSWAAYLKTQAHSAGVIAHSVSSPWRPTLRQCPDGSLLITFEGHGKPYWVFPTDEKPVPGSPSLVKIKGHSDGTPKLADAPRVLMLFNALCAGHTVFFMGYDADDGQRKGFNTRNAPVDGGDYPVLT